MRGRNHFKATDMKRAITAAQKAGLKVGSVEIGPDGRIVIVAAKDSEVSYNDTVNPWDEVHAANQKRPA
jgi:hypothetical protein